MVSTRSNLLATALLILPVALAGCDKHGTGSTGSSSSSSSGSSNGSSSGSTTPPPTGPTTQDPDPILPNLITLPPHDLSIQYATLAGGKKQKQLRLSNTVRNIGKGPLHMLGLKATDKKPWESDHLPLIAATPDPFAPTTHDDGTATAVDQDAKGYQGIEVAERVGGKFSRWVPKYYYGPVGNMFFHAQHNHIHFNGFARYLILNENLRPASGIQPGRKVSFCIEDYSQWAKGIQVEGMPASGRFACGMEQGISPGWEDTYGAGIEGQFVDVTGLPDGKYYCYTAATRGFKETATDDNDSATLFEIHGDTLTVKEELDNAKLQARAKQIEHDQGLLQPLLPPPNPNPPPTSPAPTTPTPPAAHPAPSTPATSGLASGIPH